MTEPDLQLRAELLEGRGKIRQMHDSGIEGEKVSARLASLFDSILLKLLEGVLAEEPPPKEEVLGSLAVVCLGSYARRQCAPYSDIDLMLLYRGRQPKWLVQVVRRFTHGVFDLGLQLGHSLRTPAQAVQMARQDAVICTSLMGARFLAGNQSIFDQFRDAYRDELQRRGKNLCQAIIEARREERDRYGKTLYLLEPNVKRSRGGLRDINLLRWLGVIQHGEGDPGRLHALGALSKMEHRRLLSSRAYLLRLRNEMHFHAGKANDHFGRAEQLRIAERYGHTRRDGLLPVEHLMRDYFRHANNVWQLVRRRQAVFTAESTISWVLDPVMGRTVEGGLRVGTRHVSATPSGLAHVADNLQMVLGAVELSVRENKPLEGKLWMTLEREAPNAPQDPTPEEIERFLNLVADRQTAGGVLRMLHELRYLDRFVPATRHARCMLQFNQYHKYTVDEHSLRAVEECALFAERDDALGRAYRAVDDQCVLHLALLLHDLGKGYDEDHSEVGGRLAAETAERLKLDKPRAEDLIFLVHQHLAMPHLAFHRDSSDTRLVQAFVKKAATGERLRMMFVLACADLAAVGPGVLNAWKVEVLSSLFLRTLPLIEKGDEAEDDTGLGALKAETLALLAPADQDEERMAAYADRLPVSIASSRGPEELAEILRGLGGLAARQAHVWARALPETGNVELIAGVESGSGRGVFSSMAGALANKGVSILTAETIVMPDGLLLLRYETEDPQLDAGLRTERLEEVSNTMIRSVDSDTPPVIRQTWGEQQSHDAARLSGLPNEVRIHTELSSESTVIEVFTTNRPGLLYALARRLHDLRLVIRHAKIATYVDQVVDVFYVTELDGWKATDPERLDTVQAELLRAAEGEDCASCDGRSG